MLKAAFNLEEHLRNRSRFPDAELQQYAGQQVAWSLDGTRIVASGVDPVQVCQDVLKQGLQSDEVVLSYVPFPEEVCWGAGVVEETEK